MSDVFESVVRDHGAFLRQAAVGAARELGLFAALDPPAPLDTLATRVGVARRRLRALVDVLLLDGFLSCTDGVLAVARDVPPMAALPPEGWGRLAEVLRRDRPLPLPDPGPYHAHLLSVGAPAARELAAAVCTPDIRRVIDVGCGAGVYASACLAQRPDVTATLVDDAATLERARAHLGAVAERVTFVAGDVRGGAAGHLRDGTAGHDLALLVNVLHLHGEDACEAIVRATARTLAPDGRLVIKDLVVAPDRSGPAVALWFALDMAIYTDAGDVYPEHDVRAWLAAAGLTKVERLRLASSPDALVLAARRAPAGRPATKPDDVATAPPRRLC